MTNTTSLLMLILQEQWKYYTAIHFLLKTCGGRGNHTLNVTECQCSNNENLIICTPFLIANLSLF